MPARGGGSATWTYATRTSVRAEIAYLAHPWARGRGLMERAARLALQWGFEERGLETVIWYAHVGNWASRRLAWKTGFMVQGVLPGWCDYRDELRDSWVGTLRRGAPLTPATPWLETPRIAGRSVALRPLRDEDAPRIIEACTDPVTRAWLGRMPDPYGDVEALEFIETTKENAAAGRTVTWAMADPADDRLLGVINVFDIDDVSGEVGYWVHPGERGRGVATEATWLALRHGFRRCRRRRPRAHHYQGARSLGEPRITGCPRQPRHAPRWHRPEQHCARERSPSRHAGLRHGGERAQRGCTSIRICLTPGRAFSTSRLEFCFDTTLAPATPNQYPRGY